MEFFDVVNSRRSVRKFTDEPVARDVLEKIVAAGIEAPSGCNMQLRQYVIVDDPGQMDRLRELCATVDDAPAAIVLLIEPTGTKYGEFYVQDASAAMENMLLTAVDLGYAGCWVEGAIRRCEDELRKLFDVSSPFRVWSLTPIGRPADTPKRPAKSDPKDVTHYNRCGAG